MPTYPTYKLGEISKIYNGNSINAEEKEKKYRGVDGRNYIGTKDIDFDCSVNYNNGVKIPFDEKKFKVAPAGSVLVCAEGGSAGKKSAYISEDVCFGNKLFAITNNQNLFEGKYVFYYTRYKKFFDLFKNELSGLIGGVSSKKFGEIPIPLPPLPTQHQIVSRIESLFAELDKAVEHLRTTQQQLKIYRQAVLNHWLNNEDGKWETVKLGEVAEVKRGRSKHRPRNDKSLFGGKYPFIQTGEIREAKGGTITTYSQTYSEKGLEQSRLWPKGTLCLTIAANIAETAYLGFDACFPDSVVGIIARQDRLNLDYFNCYIQLIKQMIEQQASATAQKNINVDYLENLQIPLPPLSEQQRIVEEIETRLSQAEAAEARIAEALQKTEALRQSILKKAFSGEFDL